MISVPFDSEIVTEEMVFYYVKNLTDAQTDAEQLQYSLKFLVEFVGH